MLQSFPPSVASALGMTLHSTPATDLIEVESVGPEISNANVRVNEELPASSRSPYITVAVSGCKRGN